MDGSTAIIAVYGQPNVGKTTFIARCLNIDVEDVFSVTKSSINVCGRDINIQLIENPEQITRAVLAIMLYDISSPESFLSLSETFDRIHRLCPTAYIVVIGTKADLRTSKCVTTQEAEAFCKNFQDGNVQYYETAINPPDAIPAIFKEILARPLINLAILKIATVQENITFVHDTMDWALENGSANILTHLRDLGYEIPEDLVLKYQELVVSYLLQEYPLKQLPSFKLVPKPSLDQTVIDSELDEDDEPMDVVDHYKPLKVTKADFLNWSDISLTLFPSSFITQDVFNLRTLSHVDLSRNSLSAIPTELFLIPGLIFLNVSDNQITSLPSPSLWTRTKIEILMLAQNKIAADTAVIVPPKSPSRDVKLFSKLWYLDISHNTLNVCPGWVFALQNLKHLDISGNMIQVLPSELGNLNKLTTLLIEGLPLMDPPPPIPSLGTQILLRYLHLKSLSSQPLNCMRVIVVGPTKVGKTTLLNCVRGDGDVKALLTKGLEVTHWHYKGEILKRKAVNIDFWDFSGSPKYKQIYSCFNCQESLHLAVFSIHTTMEDIIQWLSDIQSFSKERLPVLVVFTHMDTVSTKELKEEVKRKRTEWIKYNLNMNQQLDNSTTFTLLSSTMTQAVKSLQDTSTLDRHSLYMPPQQAFDRQEYSGNCIPLMPLVLQNPYFISCPSNDGISQLRKTLYRIGTGSFQSSLSCLNTIIIEVPNVYVQVINLIKQLQGHLKTVKTEGEQKPFYTYSELMERLRRPIKQMNITGDDFLAALRFLHKRGIVYIFDNTLSTSYGPSDILIAISPQIIGYLLQRTMRAGEAHSESNILPGFLPNVHPNMIWGVDPIVNLIEGGGSHGISPTQLINFLSYVDILAPVVPGACIVPSLLPTIPVEGTSLDLNDLECKRVYLLGYLPTFFWSHAVTRILQGLKRNKLIGVEDELVPSSPSVAPTRPTNPLVTPTKIKLYLWQKNFVLEDVDQSLVWVHVLEGGQLGPESTPFCGRIDVLIKAPRAMEAVYLRVITTEIDKLLEDRYPSLLDDSSTPLQVEIFIPLTPQWFSNVSSPNPVCSSITTNSSSSSNPSGPVPVPEPKTRSVSNVSVARSDLSITIHGTLQEAFVSIKNTGTLPLHSGSIIGSPRQSLSVGEDTAGETMSTTEAEYENIPASGSRLSFVSLSSAPAQYLVPMWECLQEVYKPLSQQLKNGMLDFQGLLPDLLYADFAASSFIAVPESYMTGVKIQEERGMFMRYYYNNYGGEQSAKVMGATKTFSLQSHVVKLGTDYKLLSSLSCPYIVSTAGINISPPVLGLSLAPLGSLRQYMASGKPLLQRDIHQIGLQVLSAIEYLDELDLSYHFISAESVFMWCSDPVLIKLSDAGLTHESISCQLCANLNTSPSNEDRKAKATQFNLIMFGLILYEVSVGERPLEGVMPFSVLILNLYHQKAILNIEAAITHKCLESNHQLNGKDKCVKACHVLCLQTVLNLCTKIGDISIDMIRARLSLCAGEENWAPLKLTLDIECMLANRDSSLVYWASGSRGLVVGTINPVTGELYRHILAEAPTPESGLFANRRGKPIPIAVGHATAVDVCFATNQLWVGTENGLMGSVYVFDLPDMKSHHYIHLQDAVLSLKVVNDEMHLVDSDKHQYHVLVGLANGTIILFMGKSGGQPLKNPLQGPRKVIVTTDRKPCLSISITSSGHFWCGCGNSIEVIESSTLRSLYRHQCLMEDNGDNQSTMAVTPGSTTAKVKGDVIVLMGMNSRGIWTVTRRSTVLRLWNSVTGELKVSFNVRNILECSYNEISALLVDGGVVWVGTRNGFLMLLDASAIEKGEHEGALRALQYCGDGRIKSLASLKNLDSSSLRVLCSIEYPDEVSGCLMRWEYQSVHPWQPKETTIIRSSMFELQPVRDKNSHTNSDPIKSV